jgi:hypothetical protein
VKAKTGARVGVGLVLVILGVKNIVYPFPDPPVGAIQDVTYYGFSAAIVVAGLWFVFRRRREDKAENIG